MDIFRKLPLDVQKLITHYLSHPNADSIRSITNNAFLVCKPGNDGGTFRYDSGYFFGYNLGTFLRTKPIFDKLIMLIELRKQRPPYGKTIAFKTAVTNLIYDYTNNNDVSFREKQLLNIFNNANLEWEKKRKEWVYKKTPRRWMLLGNLLIGAVENIGNNEIIVSSSNIDNHLLQVTQKYLCERDRERKQKKISQKFYKDRKHFFRRQNISKNLTQSKFYKRKNHKPFIKKNKYSFHR